MAFKLYVGNYPFTFTKDDVQNLFRDFDGVKIDNVCQLERKSFSFITCTDIEQVVSLIKKMNGKMVSGRHLVVRASDSGLQDYVNLILQSEGSSPHETQFKQNERPTSHESQFKQNERPISHESQFKQNERPISHESQFKQNERPTSHESQFQQNERSTSHESQFIQNERSTSHESKCWQNEGSSFYESQFIPIQVMKNKHRYQHDKNGSEASNICRKSGAYNTHFNEEFPKKEGNTEFSVNNPTCISKSKYNSYQKNHDVNVYEEYTKNSSFASKFSNPTSNYESYKNTYAGSSLNHYQTKNDYFKTNSNPSFGLFQKNHNQATKTTDIGFSENTSSKPEKHYHHSLYERNDHSQFKRSHNNSMDNSYYNNSDIHTLTPQNKNAESFYKEQNKSTPTWVSVANFRLGTTVKKLYNLFADYKPFKINMICNEPRRDKTLTEAHICFPSRDIADDVILNFDNTMLEGRIILVNDVEDSTILNELLRFKHT